MKFRIIASLVVLSVLAVLVFVYESGNSRPSFETPSGFEDAKNLKIN